LFPALAQAGMTFNHEHYSDTLTKNGYCLDEIPDFGGLLPKANNTGVPVFELTDAEIGETGPVLSGMCVKREQLRDQFTAIANEITNLLVHV